MRKVSGRIRLTKKDGGEDLEDYSFYLVAPRIFKENLILNFVQDPLSFRQITLGITVTEQLPPKTKSQIGYWLAEVLPKAVLGFHEKGYRTIGMSGASYFLRKKFMFEEVKNYETGEIEKIPIEIKDAKRAEMSLLLDESIIFIEHEFKIAVQSPQDYEAQQDAIKEFKVK